MKIERNKLIEILSFEELSYEIKEIEKILNDYASELQKRGYCEQCCYPYHDGICSCGDWDDVAPYSIMICELYDNWLLPYKKQMNKIKVNINSRQAKEKINNYGIIKKQVLNLFDEKIWKEEIQRLDDFVHSCEDMVSVKGFCSQCANPTYRGICSCGRHLEIPIIVYDLFSFFMWRSYWYTFYIRQRPEYEKLSKEIIKYIEWKNIKGYNSDGLWFIERPERD